MFFILLEFFVRYSWPNVICCFIGGFLLDRIFGIRLGTALFAATVLLGQVLFVHSRAHITKQKRLQIEKKKLNSYLHESYSRKTTC